MTEEEYMLAAIRAAQAGIELGQSPFGSVLVLDGRIVAAAHNTVWRDLDPTAHAEVNCIRQEAHVQSGLLAAECAGLFRQWLESSQARAY